MGPRIDSLGPLLLLLLGCGTTAPSPQPTADAGEPPAAAARPFPSDAAVPRPTHDDAPPTHSIALDLSDQWTPSIFRPSNENTSAATQPYRDTYVRLANEQYTEDDTRAKSDRHLELFGIFPAPSVIAKRLADEPRHQCHDNVDMTALKIFHDSLRPSRAAEQQREIKRYAQLERILTRERLSHAVATNEELLALAPKLRRAIQTVEKLGSRISAIRSIQARLRCENLLSARNPSGVFDLWTASALRAYQRLHMIPSFGQLDDYTREQLLLPSRELDFRAGLRMLRERVIDATGLLEDGSACGVHGKVLGRGLDAPAFLGPVALEGRPLLSDKKCAPDLISAQVEHVAKVLGWSTPEQLAAWLDAHPPGSREAPLSLSAIPLPTYHSPHMQLRAEIDRGDVYYDFPFTSDGRARAQSVKTRPMTTLYALDGENEIALVRWNTTIGGWKTEKIERYVAMKYKGSDVGARVWRDLVASPAWLPPDSTPHDDLVRKSGRKLVLNNEIFGPGYASAYGLVMLIHHQELKRETRTTYWDRGIRSHGSVSYHSLLRGYSHGCHRLFNHLAVRLGEFLLKHRNHITRGNEAVRYVNDFAEKGRRFRLEIKTRGYTFELTPPVPVNVLEGTLRGNDKRPSKGARPLRSALLRRSADTTE